MTTSRFSLWGDSWVQLTFWKSVIALPVFQLIHPSESLPAALFLLHLSLAATTYR
ncbi:hypothetical protein PISMIDRAFT_672831 [Pisolithus microcarpus 441]|uniref:Uncharacterized protein n=1 Tax=Pisolithus microcarpus 441 TaxID=765257 RepID=A0A0C9ZJ61_9AGAM|nr:hypothetical protein PISMIDRAFT_672831 [Pisolithus microcarpus 441]